MHTHTVLILWACTRFWLVFYIIFPMISPIWFSQKWLKSSVHHPPAAIFSRSNYVILQLTSSFGGLLFSRVFTIKASTTLGRMQLVAGRFAHLGPLVSLVHRSSNLGFPKWSAECRRKSRWYHHVSSLGQVTPGYPWLHRPPDSSAKATALRYQIRQKITAAADGRFTRLRAACGLT